MKRNNFTDTILMVRPAHFGYNPETAGNNAFQLEEGSHRTGLIKEKAQQEFDGIAENLKEHGVIVHVFEDNPKVIKPDAVFPNNWFTTHENGVLITYPMFAPARRKERDPAVIEYLKKLFVINDHIRMEQHEDDGKYLEGTGSMILDREGGVVYACLSDRTHESLLEKFCEKMNYRALVFSATDPSGLPVYHTNVIMALGNGFVVACMECVTNKADRDALLAEFKASHLELVDISFDQVLNFAGNMLQLRNRSGDPLLAMSTSAFQSLTDQQKRVLKDRTALVHSDISTIEKYGGGSVRCMIAEIFLSER